MTSSTTFTTSGRDVWRELHRLGVTPIAIDGVLTFKAPIGVVTDSLKAAMKQHKAELLAIAAGDYLTAAMQLLTAGIMADRQRQRRVVEFDRFVAERKALGVECNAAHREAYILLTRDIQNDYEPDEYDCLERQAIQQEAA